MGGGLIKKRVFLGACGRLVLGRKDTVNDVALRRPAVAGYDRCYQMALVTMMRSWWLMALSARCMLREHGGLLGGPAPRVAIVTRAPMDSGWGG